MVELYFGTVDSQLLAVAATVLSDKADFLFSAIGKLHFSPLNFPLSASSVKKFLVKGK